MTLATRIDSSSEVEGMPTTRNMIASSCSVGMNSLPRNGNSASAPISSASAAPTTIFLRSSAQSSSGRYSRFAPRTSQVSFSSLGLRISAHSTGTSVSDSSSEPAIAKVMVSAIGLNSLPSSPVSENSGRKTTMMIRMAKAIGLATSRAASSTTWVRLIGLPDERACDSSRKAFSTITTAPSTIMPMPMARPASDIRLADMPTRHMQMKANSIASGKVTMTTMAERNSPRNRNRITATRIEPSISALVEVFSALSTISVRS